MDWLLYDRSLPYERINRQSKLCLHIINTEPKHVFPQILVQKLPNLNFQ